jgi:hypothetical protein
MLLLPAAARLSDRFHPLNDLEGGAAAILKTHKPQGSSITASSAPFRRASRRFLPGRTQVVERTRYAGVESSAVFAERLVTQLQARCVFHARQVFLVADGAEWIKAFLERYLAHAFYLLDWYHLVENLRCGLGHRHPPWAAPSSSLAPVVPTT